MYKFRTTLENAIICREQGKYEEAFACFLQCAKQGNSYAMECVSRLYATGRGTEMNREEAQKWALSSKFYRCRDKFYDLYKDKSIEECEQDVANGNTNAMLWLARCYAKGECSKAQDYDKSLELIAKAADMGNPDAMCQYGLCLKEGDPFPMLTIEDSWEKRDDTPLPQDFDAALVWFRRACDYGVSRAIHCISSYYVCVENNHEMFWFYCQMASRSLMRLNPEAVSPELLAGMEFAIRDAVPQLLVCDRCGKQFFGLISRSSYTCDTCHETSLLCPECQENINCYCGRTMRLTDEE